jgi:hypothetical protein
LATPAKSNRGIYGSKQEFDDMKKIGFTLLVLLALVLSACGSSSSTNATQSEAGTQATTGTQAVTGNQSAAAGSQNTSNNDLSTEYQLIIGTFKLEDTDLAVTANQASVLVPLWQQVAEMTSNMGPGMGNAPQGTDSQAQAAATPVAAADNSDSQAQIDILVKQIQAAMTTDQLTAIADMDLTQASAMTILQDLEISMGGPGGNGLQQPVGTPPAGQPQAPQGTPVPNNGQAQPGNPPSGNGQSNQTAFPGGQMGFLPPNVITALVQLLQTKAGLPTSTPSGSNNSPANMPAGNASSSTSSSSATGAYTLDGKSDSQTGQAYTASNTDESAVYVANAGNLTLTNSTVTTTGNTSSTDNSSFYGLNAAVLAASGSTVSISNTQVTTSGTGANGVFSTGSGSTVSLSNIKITATGDGGHAVMATQGGVMTITNVDMTTSGSSASAIATDRGGGTITVTGGTVKTSGMNSACLYSTGNITVTGASCSAIGAEAAVIEGGNYITLTNTSLTSSQVGKWGVMIYQSMSGDAAGTQGAFTMTGGSLAYTVTDGPLFYVNNSTAIITLKGVNVSAASGILVKAAAGNWGNSGSNGGTVILTADGQVLTGNLVADNLSVISLTLQNGSSLDGTINGDHTAGSINLTLDSTSSWNVTADSYLTGFSDAGAILGATITNITGNGHTVYYDSSLAVNSSLGGKTYTLAGSGSLQPLK